MPSVTSALDDADSKGVINRTQATGVGLAGLLSAAVSYAVLVAAAHTLTPADNAIFLTYWALLFGLFGVLTGLNPEAARAAYQPSPAEDRGARIVPAGVGFAAALCLALGASGVLWARRVLDADHAWLLVVVVVAGVAFSGHLATAGVLAGRGRWRSMVLASVCESAVRGMCVLVAVLAFDSLAGLALASAVSAGAWLAMLGRRDVRAAVAARGDVPGRVLTGNFAHACVASASSAALIVGFPVLIRLTTDPVEYLGAAGLLLAISLTRAPLMVPLNAYQGVALRHFLRHRHRGVRALYPIAGAVLAVTALAAVAAALVGPWLFGLLLGHRYSVDAWTLAGLTVGAGLLALLTLTGVSCLAVGGHRSFAVGWVSATLAAVLVLLLPLELEVRTVLALEVSPLVGSAVHVWAIRAAVHRHTPLDAGAGQEGR